MSFLKFRKKKSSSLHTLSEKEIQNRLYGEFAPSSEKADRQRKLPAIDPHSPDKISQVQVAATQSAGSGSSDLFTHKGSQNSPPQVTDIDPAERVKFPSDEERLEQDRMRRLESLAEQETRAKQSGPASGEKPGALKIKQPKKVSRVDFKKNVLQVFKTIGALIISGLLWCAGLIAGAIQWADFRRQRVRRIFFWLLSLSILAGLFFGIHLLNVNRENAMKMGRTTKSVSAEPRDTRVDKSAKTSAVSGVSEKSGAAGRGERAGVLSPAIEEAVISETATPEDPAKPEPKKPYVIQVATYINTNDAERVLKKLQDSGLAAFVKDLRRPSGKVYYSVFVGRFVDFREAQAEFEIFKQKDVTEPFDDAFIRSLE